jgi:ubiquinone/menaquinone biosynthesis C-methylase UbiE
MSPEAELSDSEVVDVVRAGYDAIAGRYASYADGMRSHPRHAWVERLVDLLAPSSNVVELGCGPGVPTAARIVASGHHVVGVDVSAGQLDIARRRVPQATFVQADMLEFDADEASVDAVVALYSFIHVPRHHYPDLFERISRWLVPGGWLLGTFGTGDSPGWLEEDLLGFGAANWTNSYDPETTRELIRAAGLVPETAEVVTQEEPTGLERWLYVLAQRR